MNNINAAGRTILLKFIVAGMQLCWLYAVINLFNDYPATIAWPLKTLFSAYPVAIGIYVGVHYLARRGRLREFIGVICLCVYLTTVFKFAAPGEVLNSFRPPLMNFFYYPRQVLFGYMPYSVMGGSALVQWGLGRRLVQKKFDFAMFLVEFQFGFGCLLTALALENRFDVSAALMNVFIALFFLFSLSGIALARLNSATIRRDQPFFPLGLFYLSISGGAILLLTFLALMIITPKTIEAALNFLSQIKQLLLALADTLMALLPEAHWTPQEIVGGGGCGPVTDNNRSNASLDTSAHELGLLLYKAVWIGFFLFILWRIAGSVYDRLKNRSSPPSHASGKRLTGAFKADLVALLSFLYASMGRWVGTMARLMARLLPQRLTPRTKLSVGRIYQELLRWSASAGFEKPPHETPYEHARRVSRCRPQTGKEFLSITKLFANDFYGNKPPSAEEHCLMLEEWRRLKTKGKRKIWRSDQMWMFPKLKKPLRRLRQTSPRSLSASRRPSN